MSTYIINKTLTRLNKEFSDDILELITKIRSKNYTIEIVFEKPSKHLVKWEVGTYVIRFNNIHVGYITIDKGQTLMGEPRKIGEFTSKLRMINNVLESIEIVNQQRKHDRICKRIERYNSKINKSKIIVKEVGTTR
jgi:hypothetical protein